MLIDVRYNESWDNKIELTVLLSGPRELFVKSVIARVRNTGRLFQSPAGDSAAVRISGVSVIARCPQGER